MSEFAKATLTAKTDQSGREIPVTGRQPLEVDFNPETLRVTITNAMQANRRRRREPPQLVTDSTAKLAVELVFDTTTVGFDVRETTHAIAMMMKPKGTAEQQQRRRGIPAIVIFEWGTFLFEGYIDSFGETLDFFAAEGVPLRSTVSLSITEQDDPFRAPGGAGAADVGLGDDVLPSTAPPVPVPADRSIDDVALASGDPAAAGRIATANGIENRRFPEVAALTLPQSAGRVSAAFTAGASAGFAAGADAFAGLNAQATAAVRPRIELAAQVPALGLGVGLGVGPGVELGAGAGAGVRLGGSARASAGASLRADVGGAASVRIIFEES